jgi:uncharacterized protein YggE
MSTPTNLPTVCVRANAGRAVEPDSYVVIARALGHGADSAGAARELSARCGELDAAVLALPRLSADIERGAVVVHPDWESAKGRKAQRWHGSREMRVSGHDTRQVAELVGAISAVAGVEIEGPHWQLGRDNPAHAELAAEAVREAMTRARRYAAALGGTLGRLVELSDTGMGGGMRHFSAGSVSAGASPGLDTLDFTPQPVDLSAGVEARWYLTLPG